MSENNLIVGHYGSCSYGLPRVTKFPPMPKCKPLKEEVDPVNKPEHYQYSGIEAIDVIDAWELDYYLGNTIKYICRYKHKEKPLIDLKKALWHLNKKIEEMEKKCISE
jgi:hypothetical protein